MNNKQMIIKRVRVQARIY